MENNKEMRTWLDDLKLDHPLVIAGPCSAETEAQVLGIAHQLKDTDVNYYRAGIWKPRTRPGMFEGVGALGLKWLQKVKEETGLKTATEVANRAHVELALEHDIDLLWIGARSTVSPFIVQEIADALKGTDKIVLVKNPVNRFPDLPLINDPSHITGKRDMIFDVCQTALDLNFDGLMVETHSTPDEAWSDASQQVTPETLIQIMRDLRIRKESDPEKEYNADLSNLRAKIDVVDNQLIEMLGKRMRFSDGIGALKKEKNVAVLQSKRWNEILGNMVLEGDQNGLSEEFILKMFKAIHQESINHQEKIING